MFCGRKTSPGATSQGIPPGLQPKEKTMLFMSSPHGQSAPRSLSDDDLCATCENCRYAPGELSHCSEGWPGNPDPSEYVSECPEYREVQEAGGYA